MCSKLTDLQSTYHLMQYTFLCCIETFFPLLKTVFELINLDAFQCFCHFLFHLYHYISLCELFSSRETKKCCLG